MTITVIRHTGLTTGGAIAIKINRKKVATVNPEQQIQVDLPEETATVQVSQWGANSKPIEVQNGETIEITSWKGTKKVFFLYLPTHFILTLFINIYIPTVHYRMIAITILAVVYLIVAFQINWYQLRKI